MPIFSSLRKLFPSWFASSKKTAVKEKEYGGPRELPTEWLPPLEIQQEWFQSKPPQENTVPERDKNQELHLVHQVPTETVQPINQTSSYISPPAESIPYMNLDGVNFPESSNNTSQKAFITHNDEQNISPIQELRKQLEYPLQQDSEPEHDLEPPSIDSQPSASEGSMVSEIQQELVSVGPPMDEQQTLPNPHEAKARYQKNTTPQAKQENASPTKERTLTVKKVPQNYVFSSDSQSYPDSNPFSRASVHSKASDYSELSLPGESLEPQEETPQILNFHSSWEEQPKGFSMNESLLEDAPLAEDIQFPPSPFEASPVSQTKETTQEYVSSEGNQEEEDRSGHITGEYISTKSYFPSIESFDSLPPIKMKKKDSFLEASSEEELDESLESLSFFEEEDSESSVSTNPSIEVPAFWMDSQEQKEQPPVTETTDDSFEENSWETEEKKTKKKDLPESRTIETLPSLRAIPQNEEKTSTESTLSNDTIDKNEESTLHLLDSNDGDDKNDSGVSFQYDGEDFSFENEPNEDDEMDEDDGSSNENDDNYASSENDSNADDDNDEMDSDYNSSYDGDSYSDSDEDEDDDDDDDVSFESEPSEYSDEDDEDDEMDEDDGSSYDEDSYTNEDEDDNLSYDSDERDDEDVSFESEPSEYNDEVDNPSYDSNDGEISFESEPPSEDGDAEKFWASAVGKEESSNGNLSHEIHFYEEEPSSFLELASHSPEEQKEEQEKAIPSVEELLKRKEEEKLARLRQAEPLKNVVKPIQEPKRNEKAPWQINGYIPPSLDFLEFEEREVQVDEGQEELLLENAEKLEKTLESFNVKGKVMGIYPGPVITMYEYLPEPGIKVSKISGLSDDLAMALSALQVRVIAPLPGKGVVGIELPNKNRDMVYLKELLADKSFSETKFQLPMAMGKTTSGDPFIANLAKMPHLLIAGTTGSGKSVGVNSMLCSLLYHSSPEDVRFLMIDPKMLELSIYEGIPHLLLPVVTEPTKAAIALNWAVTEMERRYSLMSEAGVRNLDNYNALIAKRKKTKELIERREAMIDQGKREVLLDEQEAEVWEEMEDDFDEAEFKIQQQKEQYYQKLPYIVVIIDELADLMMVAGKDVEISIARLAQMARAAGLHLMVATQRPSVDVLTGVIKANFPTRLAFQLKSKIDSRTILDVMGAEKLLGMGDMLLIPPTSSSPIRLHAPYLSEEEIHLIVKHLKKQGKPEYNEDILKGSLLSSDSDDGLDELYDQAIAVIAQQRKASAAVLQKSLKIGYSRASKILDQLEADHVIGPKDGNKPREILLPLREDDFPLF